MGFEIRSYEKPIGARFLGAVLAVVVLAGEAHAQAPSEQELTRRVCTAGPDALLAKAQQLGGEAELIAYKVSPNPSLVVEHQQSLSGPAERETILGLSVPLTISGRRSLLKDAGHARKDQTLATSRVTLLESALEFRGAYATALLAQERTRILTEQQAALDALTAVIEGLERGGEAAGYDRLRQQTQARLHQQQLQGAILHTTRARASLNLWLDGEVVLPNASEEVLVTDAGRISKFDLSASQHPQEQMWLAAARASALERDAARRRWVPDLDLFAGYRTVAAGGSTGHGIALQLGVPLTFFDHGQGDAARADAERSLALASAQGVKRRADLEVRMSQAQLTQLLSRLDEAAKLHADAQTLQGTAQKLYTAGEATLTELLDAYDNVEQARLSKLELVGEILNARLTLMRAAATLFDPALDRLCGGGKQ
jgi:cobalt-zinc-cadmium efflux system outer membrane protein